MGSLFVDLLKIMLTSRQRTDIARPSRSVVSVFPIGTMSLARVALNELTVVARLVGGATAVCGVSHLVSGKKHRFLRGLGVL